MNWRAGTFSALLLALLCGCAEVRLAQASFERPFRFEEDSFAFANELVWSYAYDTEGTWRATGRARDASYTHRCFVLARSARQFFQHARFDPSRVSDQPVQVNLGVTEDWSASGALTYLLPDAPAAAGRRVRRSRLNTGERQARESRPNV